MVDRDTVGLSLLFVLVYRLLDVVSCVEAL